MLRIRLNVLIPAFAILCLVAPSIARAVPIDPLPPVVEAPVVVPPGGYFTDSVAVSLVTETEGAKIFYTLDGSAPTELAMIYAGPIMIRATTTLRVVAMKAGMRASTVTIIDYVKVARLDKPMCSLVSGYYANDTLIVTLSASTPGSVIRYTLDGSDPSASGVIYSGPILITSSVTLRAMAVADGYVASEVMTAEYTLLKGAGVRAPAAVRASGKRAGLRDAMGRARSGRALPFAAYLPLSR